MMKYKSHKIAQNFYTFAVVLFLVQVLVGIIAAVQFIWPDIFILKFNIIRTLHINALVVWILSGLMGASYYVVSAESESEIWSVPLAIFQFWATVVTITLVVLGYVWMGLDPQANVLVMGTNLLNEGREYIEAPRWADFLIALSVILFLVNCFMTMYKSGRWTAIQGTLLGGLTFLALMYLPGMVYMKSMVTWPSTAPTSSWWWLWFISPCPIFAASSRSTLLGATAPSGG